MKTLPLCLGLVHASEQELAGACVLLGERHNREYEITTGCRLFTQWSRIHAEQLKPFVELYGSAPNPDPGRLRAALFPAGRMGGFGLLRDLQDLLLLIHQARTAWTALMQAATELRDIAMTEASRLCAEDIDRQIDWACTHIKTVSPQALTVPPAHVDELAAAVSEKPTPGG